LCFIGKKFLGAKWIHKKLAVGGKRFFVSWVLVMSCSPFNFVFSSNHHYARRSFSVDCALTSKINLFSADEKYAEKSSGVATMHKTVLMIIWVARTFETPPHQN
jgi:hypothetical protein